VNIVPPAYYTMNREGIVVEATFAEAQAQSESEAECAIAFTKLDNGTLVSTAFVPICLVFEDGKPQCFETVHIHNMKAKTLKRYSTFEDARKGHDILVHRLNS